MTFGILQNPLKLIQFTSRCLRQSLTNKDGVPNSSYFSLKYLETNDNGVLSAESAMLNVYIPFHQADFTSAMWDR